MDANVNTRDHGGARDSQYSHRGRTGKVKAESTAARFLIDHVYFWSCSLLALPPPGAREWERLVVAVGCPKRRFYVRKEEVGLKAFRFFGL